MATVEYDPDQLVLTGVVAANVRAERARLGLGQDRLAQRLGWPSRSQVSDLEKHRRRVDVEDLFPLCRALGVGLDVLLRGAPAEMLAALGVHPSAR